MWLAHWIYLLFYLVPTKLPMFSSSLREYFLFAVLFSPQSGEWSDVISLGLPMWFLSHHSSRLTLLYSSYCRNYSRWGCRNAALQKNRADIRGPCHGLILSRASSHPAGSCVLHEDCSLSLRLTLLFESASNQVIFIWWKWFSFKTVLA